MFKNVSNEIRDCYKQAEACAQHAAAQTDPELGQDFLVMEAAWLKLARLRERDLSDRIRERAHEMWVASGSDGEAEQHWLAAEREILSAPQSPSGSTESREAETEILEELRQSLSERKSGGS